MRDTLHFDNRFTRELPADLQRGHAGEYALSCSNISGAQYQVHGTCYSLVAPTPVAAPCLIAYASEVAQLIDRKW